MTMAFALDIMRALLQNFSKILYRDLLSALQY